VYKDLFVWQKAYSLGLIIYKMTKSFPKEEQFGITGQLRRSATSIDVNIAEGSSRQSQKEFKQFVSIAKGSLSEVENWILYSKDLDYISDKEFQELSKEINIIGSLLLKLYNSI
jgi:four helix bundle protein